MVVSFGSIILSVIMLSHLRLCLAYCCLQYKHTKGIERWSEKEGEKDKCLGEGDAERGDIVWVERERGEGEEERRRGG